MNRIDAVEEGIGVEAQCAEVNIPTDPEASLLLEGSGGATVGLGSPRRVEVSSEKEAPLGGATCNEFGICVGKAVK